MKTAHKFGRFVGTASVPSPENRIAQGLDSVNCGANCIGIDQKYNATVKK